MRAKIAIIRVRNKGSLRVMDCEMVMFQPRKAKSALNMEGSYTRAPVITAIMLPIER